MICNCPRTTGHMIPGAMKSSQRDRRHRKTTVPGGVQEGEPLSETSLGPLSTSTGTEQRTDRLVSQFASNPKHTIDSIIMFTTSADTTVNSVAKKSVAKRQYASHDPHPPSHPPPISTAATATVDSSPRHARGAGPYVDKYILQDKDRQRQRNLDNTAFIKAQIAEKERIKLEAKLERGREERVEERRMARERERLDKEFQREQLRKRAKEVSCDVSIAAK